MSTTSSPPPSLPPLSSSPNTLAAAISTAIPTSDPEESDADDEPAFLPPGLTQPPILQSESTSRPNSPPAVDPLPRMPVPTVSPGGEAVSFAYPDPKDPQNESDPDSILRRPFPAELSTADITISPDSSFIETSSNRYAMELKKRYDTMYGVGVAVRSPYTIVAFIGQHGQPRYRVGHRDMAAPGFKVDDVPTSPPPSLLSKSPPSSRRSKSNPKSKPTSVARSPVGGSKSPVSSLASPSGSSDLSYTSPSPRTSHHAQAKSQSYSRASKRHSRGRISINALLGSSTQSSSGSGAGFSATSSVPVGGSGGGSRKLKKPRSNPDLSLSSSGQGLYPPSSYRPHHPNLSSSGTGPGAGGGAAAGRMHSLSVTAKDMPHVIGIDPADPYPMGSFLGGTTIGGVKADPEKKGDAFGDVMGWSSLSLKDKGKRKGKDRVLHNQSSVSTIGSTSSTSASSTGYVSGPGAFSDGEHPPPPAPGENPSSGQLQPVSFVSKPFGSRVYFDIPGGLHSHLPPQPHTHTHSRTQIKSSRNHFRSSLLSSQNFYSGDSSESDHSDTDYGRFLKVSSSSQRFRSGSGNGVRKRGDTRGGTGGENGVGSSGINHLRVMQSFESGLTITAGDAGGGERGEGKTPIASTFSPSSSPNPQSPTSPLSPSIQPLHVDLDLGEVNFGDIVDLAWESSLSDKNKDKGKGKVVERQKSAIRLSERVEGSGMKTQLHSQPEVDPSGFGSGPRADMLSGSTTPPTSPPVKSRLSIDSELEYPLHIHPDTSDVDSILHQDRDEAKSPVQNNVSPSSTTPPSASVSDAHSSALPDSSLSISAGHHDAEAVLASTPQTPRAPSRPPAVSRIQMYLPPGLPPRLAKFTTYSTDIFDVLQTSRGLPSLDFLDGGLDFDSDDDDNGDREREKQGSFSLGIGTPDIGKGREHGGGSGEESDSDAGNSSDETSEMIVDTKYIGHSSSSSLSSLSDFQDRSRSKLRSKLGLKGKSKSKSMTLQNSKSKPKLKSSRSRLHETVPVKLSLAQDNSAAPKDDPRFVIWGKVWSSLSVGDEEGDLPHRRHKGSGGGKAKSGLGAGARNAAGFGDGGGLTTSHEGSSASGATMRGKGRASDTPFSSTTNNGNTHTSSRLPSLSIPGSSTRLSRSRSRSGSGHTGNGEDEHSDRGDHDDEGDDGSPKPRVLLAATIERWLAQLTSDLDYDELLNFFLTYRTYIGALDLARLLIARFCWALGSGSGGNGGGSDENGPGSASTTDEGAPTSATQPNRSPFAAPRAAHDPNHDNVVRRIVRVRTFVAFKQWLITFFAVDFVPNRELRLFVASHLNDLGKELVELGKDVENAVEAEIERATKEGGVFSRGEINDMKDLKERELGMSRGSISDGLSIIKKLKKVAKDCKKLYTNDNAVVQTQSSSPSTNAQSPPTSRKSISLMRNNSDDITKRASGKEHLLGQKFAEATRKLSAASTIPEEDDSDVDLDFISDGDPLSSSSMMTPFSYGGVYGNAPVNFGGASTLNLNTTVSPPGPASIPLSSFTILQRTDHAAGPEVPYSMPMSGGNGQIPHRTLSRVIVKTLGRLGRWKRVLNSGGVAHGMNTHRSITAGGRSAPNMYGSVASGGLARMAAACADVSAFDVELTVDSSDLFSSSRGVESYLRLTDNQQAAAVPRQTIQYVPPTEATLIPAPVASPPKVSTSLPITEAPSASSVTPSSAISNDSETPSDRQPVAEPFRDASEMRQSTLSQATTVFSLNDFGGGQDLDRASVTESTSEVDYGVVTHVLQVRDSPTESTRTSQSPAPSYRDSRASQSTRHSIQTTSTDSFGEPLSASRASARFPEFTSPWQFDVVSLDELSDGSSEYHNTVARGDRPAPPGLRRPPRRLPLRREFEFLDRPETVSSMGIISRSSIISAGSASGQSTASRASTPSGAGGLGGNIQQWQMNALRESLTDDEELGDVDNALRRLEGQINPERRIENARQVDGWVRTIRQRLAAGDYSDEEPMYSDDDDDDDDNEREEQAADGGGEIAIEPEDSSSPIEPVSVTTPPSTATPLPANVNPDANPGKIPQADQVMSPARSTDAKPAVEDVVPLEIRESRLASEVPSDVPERVVSITSKFVDPSNGPRVHRSFVLNFKAEELAQHFAMIDRELFMTIKFDELLLEDWMYAEEVDALDWAQFLKDRARWKAESRLPEKTSALGAVRARFNLMVNFTISEIVLTHQAERPIVFSKFLRIAWKSYLRSSFTTLVAIVTGLQSEWVVRAMRKSTQRPKEWDNRMLADFKVFTSSEDNFRHIRSAVDAINDPKPFETATHAPSVTGSTSAADKSTSSACVPFIGTYLSQIYEYNQLPVLIDPTAPNEVVTFDPVSANLSPPAHPEVFSALVPLPPSMHLEPLINVHRQRLIAGVIKSMVAGQHLASRVQFPIDKKLFHKCLRIRGLDSNTLQRALVMLPD
ncbi:hypothetical protein D9757_007421 [Collybiopsis confluens]|uniref:Ras-GEF domain-containing protein n=1 Tax=Collybiopsis confluens TaxID=2823264 RepID=A0A8H5M7A7_9AGAR|nr:hypothetical protein D9757_007421 [Collybiopsis confluens]